MLTLTNKSYPLNNLSCILKCIFKILNHYDIQKATNNLTPAHKQFVFSLSTQWGEGVGCIVGQEPSLPKVLLELEGGLGLGHVGSPGWRRRDELSVWVYCGLKRNFQSFNLRGHQSPYASSVWTRIDFPSVGTFASHTAQGYTEITVYLTALQIWWVSSYVQLMCRTIQRAVITW